MGKSIPYYLIVIFLSSLAVMLFADVLQIRWREKAIAKSSASELARINEAAVVREGEVRILSCELDTATDDVTLSIQNVRKTVMWLPRPEHMEIRCVTWGKEDRGYELACRTGQELVSSVSRNTVDAQNMFAPTAYFTTLQPGKSLKFTIRITAGGSNIPGSWRTFRSLTLAILLPIRWREYQSALEKDLGLPAEMMPTTDVVSTVKLYPPPNGNFQMVPLSAPESQ
jgi:hypothetical protein